jgi:radical SAM protein with 4Fe4S-binding SPASM domain
MKKLSLGIELTNICNLKCPFCPQVNSTKTKLTTNSFFRKKGFMSDEVFLKAVDQANLFADRVEFGFFGEQTLHPNYIKLMKLLKKRNFRVELNTNLSLVTNEMFDLWNELNIDLVKFSIDAYDNSVYQIVRPGQSFDLNKKLVTKNNLVSNINNKIKTFLAFKRRPPVRLVFVKSSFNNGQEDLFKKHWIKYLTAKDEILFKQVLSYGGKIDDDKVQMVKNCNVWDLNYVEIDWQGNVTPCNLDVNMELNIGNIMQNSLEEIYHGSKANKLRKKTGCLNPINPCSTCKDGNNWSQNEIIRVD